MKKNILLLWMISTVVTLLMPSCKKKKTDNPNSAEITAGSLSFSPLDTAHFVALVPLGNLNPPGHTFPSDHMYFYYRSHGISRNILSPGNLVIFSIARDRSGVGTPGEQTDYTISFGDPRSVVLYFGHITT